MSSVAGRQKLSGAAAAATTGSKRGGGGGGGRSAACEASAASSSSSTRPPLATAAAWRGGAAVCCDTYAPRDTGAPSRLHAGGGTGVAPATPRTARGCSAICSSPPAVAYWAIGCASSAQSTYASHSSSHTRSLQSSGRSSATRTAAAVSGGVPTTTVRSPGSDGSVA